MDIETMEALREVIEYLREDEEKDFEATDEQDRSNHIFNSVLKLEQYLDGE